MSCLTLEMEVTTEQLPKENSDSPLPANNVEVSTSNKIPCFINRNKTISGNDGFGKFLIAYVIFLLHKYDFLY